MRGELLMIVCPNCNHQNPDGAVQCEACYTPLPAMVSCPSCGTPVQADASFCGQCGFNLRTAAGTGEAAPAATIAPDFAIPDLVPPDPLISPDPLPVNVQPEPTPEPAPKPTVEVSPAAPIAPPPPPPPTPAPTVELPDPTPSPVIPPPQLVAPPPPPIAPPVPVPPSSTQLQVQTAKLLHVQTDTPIELPQHLPVVHLGKQNDRIPPDIDLSGFPNSEIVSRIHADIRVEGDAYYLEDVGSSNGTYVNNLPLPMGNRHRLRPGDRIALGKGDKVTFLFQLS